MTSTVTTTRVAYSTDGATVAFSVPFPFGANGEISAAMINNSTGAITSLNYATDYSLTGAGTGASGTLTTSIAWATGYTLEIWLAPPITQTTHYQSSVQFPSATVESNLDLLTRIALRLNDQVGRSVHAPDTDLSPTMALPSASARASTYLGFDTSGNVLVGTPVAATLGQTQVANYGTDSGAANAAVVTVSSALAFSLTTGTLLRFKAAAANTGAATLNANSTGAQPIVNAQGSALTGGELSATGMNLVQWNGSAWQLLAPDITPDKVRTAAEITASVTPVNYWYGEGVVDRYATNTTPGTTDMAPAVQAAINVALASNGGVAVRFLKGSYSIATPLTFGSATINILPLDVGGQGIGTQIINNCTASSSPLFPLAGKNGWYLHDFLMCGNSAHKNMGIQVNTIGGAESIEWRVERVTSLMAGVGLYVADTNTGSIIGYRHWPGNNPTLYVSQSVTASDISHGIYMTGSFCHNITITDPVVNGNSNYGSGAMRGIKMDCTFSYGVTINGTVLAQTLSGNNNDISIDIAPTNNATALTLQGVYAEGATVRLSNVVNSVIGPWTHGGVGGYMRFENTCRFNVIIGCQPGIVDIMDTSGASQGNTFIGVFPQGAQAWSSSITYGVGNYVSNGGVQYRCIATTTNNAPPNATYWTAIRRFQDGNEGLNLSSVPNALIGCVGLGGSDNPSFLGVKRRALLTYSASITPDVFGIGHNVIRVNNSSAFTINNPGNPRNGAELEFTIRNESGGAMGVMTVSFLTGGLVGWTNPANGYNRSFCIYYDSDFGHWYQKWVGTVDVAN